ncbi:MAG: YjbQ family protein [Deltaproteobacteria bacterium]|nr:YjbQ family protein [Deltaproteobacteria bacterium]MBW1962194.1 YjbQ family protein [Deltaproteobacteria bacterium]MBW1994062.1 YjbQ family protein [Deltaproteobacteria bacterium]MBW2152857.1 YjbQ family protein [Deltaproteobacteria bacterium]
MILTIKSKAKTEFIDITSDVQQLINNAGITDGLCLLFVPHTTAAITINESADPSVKADILSVLNKIVPWDANYRHLEGNSSAHVKSTIVGVSELIAVENRRLLLGTWQGIFFCEFDGPRTRKVHVRFLRDVPFGCA